MVGFEGMDVSLCGDIDFVVYIVDSGIIMLLDWCGNNRLDLFKNIVCDDRVSLMFMVCGCMNVVWVNGIVIVIVDLDFCVQFEKKNILFCLVIVMKVGEVYF